MNYMKLSLISVFVVMGSLQAMNQETLSCGKEVVLYQESTKPVSEIDSHIKQVPSGKKAKKIGCTCRCKDCGTTKKLESIWGGILWPTKHQRTNKIFMDRQLFEKAYPHWSQEEVDELFSIHQNVSSCSKKESEEVPSYDKDFITTDDFKARMKALVDKHFSFQKTKRSPEKLYEDALWVAREYWPKIWNGAFDRRRQQLQQEKNTLLLTLQNEHATITHANKVDAENKALLDFLVITKLDDAKDKDFIWLRKNKKH